MAFKGFNAQSLYRKKQRAAAPAAERARPRSASGIELENDPTGMGRSCKRGAGSGGPVRADYRSELFGNALSTSGSSQEVRGNEREMARLQNREPGVHIGPHNDSAGRCAEEDLDRVAEAGDAADRNGKVWLDRGGA